MRSVIEALGEQDVRLLTLDQLRRVIENTLPEQDEYCAALFKQLISLCALRRSRGISSAQAVEGIRFGIRHAKEQARWTDEEATAWRQLEPLLANLLSQESVWGCAKANDLAYEYANLFQRARIITDIRPVFNERATAIESAVVSFTLRLYFDNFEGNHSLSIALDENDLQNVKSQCDRALEKARVSKKLMGKCSVPTIIAGASDHEQT